MRLVAGTVAFILTQSLTLVESVHAHTNESCSVGIERYMVEEVGVPDSTATEYAPYVHKYATTYDIDPVLWVWLIAAESSWNPAAVSAESGALGLGQIMPGIWVQRLDYIDSADSLMDPRANLRASADILSQCFSRYETAKSALGCYHGGYRGAEDPRPSTRAYQNKILTAYNGTSPQAAAQCLTLGSREQTIGR